ncbi:MAG: hypothetical protein Kow0022_03430 [Phycisphaerales bacterium]
MSTYEHTKSHEPRGSGVIHLAVIHPGYARAMLEGRKTVESRLSRVRAVPFGRVHAGERIYFLARRGGLIVTAVADRVETLSDLGPVDVMELRRRFESRIGADDAYWQAKRAARYATLIWLKGVEACAYAPDDVHGRAGSYRSGWIIRPSEQCVYPGCVTGRRAVA